MARAVSEIGAGPPQRDARQRIEVAAARALRKTCRADLYHPLQHQREEAPMLLRYRADADSAGDVGRAVDILRAGIDQKEFAGLDHPVGLGRHAVMHDRCMFAGSRNRVEGNVLQRVLHALADAGTRRFEMIGGGDLAHRAGLCLRQPIENSTIAAPSCRCAAAEPLISTSFFTARGNLAGSAPSTTSPPALRMISASA